MARRVAYTGYDMTKDTWSTEALRDGHRRRQPAPGVGHWDRSPQNLQWKEDGTGIYFTAQDQGSQNLYLPAVPGNAGR
jgi:hypothetical protein